MSNCGEIGTTHATSREQDDEASNSQEIIISPSSSLYPLPNTSLFLSDFFFLKRLLLSKKNF